MKKFRLNKFLIIFTSAVFFLTHFAFANDGFQNNLLKVDISESSVGGVKIKLYTNKAYSDAININKKNDFEYVLYMPETSNSMTAKPNFSQTSGLKNIDIKTVQYNQQTGQKGYTKITVLTSKPIEIIPQVQTLPETTYKLSEKDYTELLSQATKKAPKPEPVKIKSSTITVAPQKIVPTTKKIQNTQTVKTPITKPIQGTKSVAPVSKKESAPVQKQPEVKIEASAQVEPPIEKEEIISPPVSIDETAEVVEAVETFKPALEQVQPEPSYKRCLKKIKSLVKKYFYYLFIFASGFLALFMLFLVKLKNRRVLNQKQQAEFVQTLKEKHEPATDYAENISEDMTWREKFQTYKESKTEAKQPDEEIVPEENQDLDELFGIESFEESNITNQEDESIMDEPEFEQEEMHIQDTLEGIPFEQEPQADYIAPISSKLDSMGVLGNQDFISEEDVSIDSLFGDDEEQNFVEQSYTLAEEAVTPIYESSPFEQALHATEPEHFVEPEAQQAEAGEEVILSEYNIDDSKGFYLVDIDNQTSLVGRIEDEFFVLKKFDEKIQGKLQARVDEQSPSSTKYMTKVGSFKALVEVSQDRMNLLIEL